MTGGPPPLCLKEKEKEKDTLSVSKPTTDLLREPKGTAFWSRVLKGREREITAKGRTPLVGLIVKNGGAEETLAKAYLVQARKKKNPAGWLVRVLARRGWSPSDEAMEVAKAELRGSTLTIKPPKGMTWPDVDGMIRTSLASSIKAGIDGLKRKMTLDMRRKLSDHLVEMERRRVAGGRSAGTV